MRVSLLKWPKALKRHRAQSRSPVFSTSCQNNTDHPKSIGSTDRHLSLCYPTLQHLYISTNTYAIHPETPPCNTSTEAFAAQP